MNNNKTKVKASCFQTQSRYFEKYRLVEEQTAHQIINL